MINKLLGFVRLSSYEKASKLKIVFTKIKTRYFYSMYFKKIGQGSIIKKPLFLMNLKYISIGCNVVIGEGIRMEAINSHKSQNFNPQIIIEDGVTFQQRCHVTAVDTLIIGKNSMISFDVSIQDSDHEYFNLSIPVSDQLLSVNKTQVGENCFIGSGVKIQAGTILGRHCVVGTNAVVRGSFPDYCVIVGIPAKIVKRYDKNVEKWRKTNEKGDFLDEI